MKRNLVMWRGRFYLVSGALGKAQKRDALGRFASGGQAPNNAKNKHKENSARFNALQEMHLTDEGKRKARDFLMGTPLARVKQNFITGETNQEKKEKCKVWIEKHGDALIMRQDTGEVVFDKKGVASSFNHRIYQNKLDILPAIPKVIEQGRLLDISNDFEGRAIKNTLIAAPVKIGKKRDIVIIRLRMIKGQDNKFYTHDIFTLRDIRKKVGRAAEGGSAGSSFDKPVGELTEAAALTYARNVLRDIWNVNRETKKASRLVRYRGRFYLARACKKEARRWA